jgi:hypothetical protein
MKAILLMVMITQLIIISHIVTVTGNQCYYYSKEECIQHNNCVYCDSMNLCLDYDECVDWISYLVYNESEVCQNNSSFTNEYDQIICPPTIEYNLSTCTNYTIPTKGFAPCNRLWTETAMSINIPYALISSAIFGGFGKCLIDMNKKIVGTYIILYCIICFATSVISIFFCTKVDNTSYQVCYSMLLTYWIMTPFTILLLIPYLIRWCRNNRFNRDANFDL